MASQLIEAKVGQEQHSSSWGKFYIHGFKLVADDRRNDRHYSFTEGAAEVADGTIFTVWAADGDKRGTDDNDYYILVADGGQEPATIDNGYGHITGCWRVLAHGDGKIRAPRLLSWAKDKLLTEAFARHLGEQIHLRGKAQPDPFEEAA